MTANESAVAAGIGMDFRTVERNSAHLQHTHIVGQQQDLHEQRLDLLEEPFTGKRTFIATSAHSCENPEDSDLPISQWSQSEVARQAVKRGIVTSISHGSVGRFFKRVSAQAPSHPVLAYLQTGPGFRDQEHRRLRCLSRSAGRS